jgi:predicted DNA-binding ribbon-helix-helix protein
MLISRNVTVSGRRTSIRLEPEMWDGLVEICRRESVTPHQLTTLVDRCRHRSSLTAKLRVFILAYFRKASTEAGHAQAGHGRVSASSAIARGRGGRRVRQMQGFSGSDTIYQAVYSQMLKLDTRRSDRAERKNGGEANY